MCIRRLQICADIINSGYKYQVSSIGLRYIVLQPTFNNE